MEKARRDKEKFALQRAMKSMIPAGSMMTNQKNAGKQLIVYWISMIADGGRGRASLMFNNVDD